MGWSEKYKKSIDCDNPKGFSQRAHCQGRKKKLSEQNLKPYKTVEQIAKKHRLEVSFIQRQLDMGEPIEHEHTKDHKLAMEIALQHLDEIPDYYTRLKKMETSAKKEHKKFKDMKENYGSENDAVNELESTLKKLDDTSYDSIDKLMRQIMKKHDMTAKQLHNAFVNKNGKTPDDWIKNQSISESRRDNKRAGDPGYSLRDWFKGGGWVQTGGKYDGKPCAKQPGQKTKPYCRDPDDRAALDKDERNKRAAKKRREDPNPNRSGKAKMVTQEAAGEKDACYKKVKSRYSVWPSAYASGALVKCRKVGAANWGNKTEELEMVRYCPACKKLEKQSDCKMGTEYWAMNSQPAMLAANQLKYDPNRPHPANEEKDHEYSMARSELSTIISAAKRLKKKMAKGEGSIEAWVQSKITKAADYIDTAADYVDSGEMNSEGVSFSIRHSSADAKKSTRQKKIYNLATSGKDGEQRNAQARTVSAPPFMVKNSYEQDGDLIDEAGKKCWPGHKKVGTQKLFGKIYNRCVKEEICPVCGFDPCQCLEGTVNKKTFQQFMEDWQSVNRKDKTDGLSPAAVKAYRRENPGSKLQTAVTEKNPSGKRAKRRLSFCRRMKGMKNELTSAKTARDPDSRINKALRRWNCN